MTRAKNADLPFITARFEIEKLIRQYFWSKNFIEVRTPLLVKSPGMEPHIKPLLVNRDCAQNHTFLPTSPEFAMKKLLSFGLKSIFQICPSFRDEPTSPEHHPEFTLLEFYESNITLEQLQNRIEELFCFVVEKTHHTSTFTFRNEIFNTTTPWPRFRIPDLFLEYLQIDLRNHQTRQSLAQVCIKHKINTNETESWDDLYFKLWLNLIEPKLPLNKLFFITHYPVSQSSLCNRIIDETGFEWANRFEVYAGHLELGNAFDELRDPVIQRANFIHDQKIRRETYQNQYPESPIDEDFLSALTKMEPACGVALGVDRLCMLILNAPHINAVLPLQSHWP